MRASDLRTKRDTLAAFLRAGSGRIIVFAVGLALIARLQAGPMTTGDWIVLAISVPMVGFVEWTIHLFLLHSPADSIRMRRLGTGTGHREHHLDPDHLGWLLLSPVDAAVFSVMITVSTAAWVGLGLVGLQSLGIVGGAGLLAPILTGVLFALASLGHYEWTHLLVHTRYRPRTRYYRRLARNHRLHHYRNERYWLGITSNLGDRVLRSYPATKSSVPRSETARTLGRSDVDVG